MELYLVASRHTSTWSFLSLPTEVHLIFLCYRPGLTFMQWYQLPEFIPSNTNSGLHSCISISIYTQHVTWIKKKLTPISTLVHPVPVTGFTQPLQTKCLHQFVHATIYTTTFPVYPLLTTSTLYWIITNAYTTDTTWASYSLLCYLLPFPFNHNHNRFII